MSEEVICLSSDEDGNDASKCLSTNDTEDSKLLSTSVSHDSKKEMPKESSPQPGCSASSIDDKVDIKAIKHITPQLMIDNIEKAIQECIRKIKELEEEDVDFDDERSSYITVGFYKRRLVLLCKKYSKMIGDSDMRKQIHKKKIRKEDIKDSMTGIDLIDQAILNLVNVDIAKINHQNNKIMKTDTPTNFIKLPDYFEVLECMKKCIKDNNIEDSNIQLEQKKNLEKLAKKAFQALGNHLKRKRVEETKSFYEFLSDGAEDPSRKDKELHQKLKKNKKDGDEKLEAVFQKYTKMQEEDAEVHSTDKSGYDTEEDDLRTPVTNNA